MFKESYYYYYYYYYYLNDIPCKNYNYTFVFVKVIPKTLLVPFFPDTAHGLSNVEAKAQKR